MGRQASLPHAPLARRCDEGDWLTEAELAAIHRVTPAEWAGLAVVLERDGFPRRDPLTGCRYAPAVRAFWNRRYGLSAVEAMTPDGTENLNAL